MSAIAFIPIPGLCAWQITGCGVRQVLIRQIRDTHIYVSRFIGHARAPGAGAGFALNISPCRLRDLFRSEAAARAEHRRRRKLTHSATDRRVRLAARQPAAPEGMSGIGFFYREI